MSSLEKHHLPVESIHAPQEETNLNHRQVLVRKGDKNNVERRLGYVVLNDYSEFSLDMYMIAFKKEDGELQVGLDFPDNSANNSGFNYVDTTELLEEDYETPDEVAEKLEPQEIEEVAVEYLHHYGDHLRTVEDQLAHDTIEWIAELESR